MTDLRRARVQRVYGPISIVFLILVLLSVGGVGYAGWSSSTVTITPLLTSVATTFPLTVGSATADTSALVGSVTTTKKSASVTVTPTGTGTPIPAHAAGDLTIINTTATTQPLAIKTRLRSDNGIIVRTTARVDVPAGGQVTAHVVADPLGDSGNLPPGKFIIVALWPGLQDKIYGQSSQALTGGSAPAGASLSINGLTDASNQAEKKIRDLLGPDQPGTLTVLDPADVVSDPKPEVASTSYTVTVTMNVTTVTYDSAAFTARQREELVKVVADGQELAGLAAPTVRIQDRPTSDQVVLEVHATGNARLSVSTAVVQPSALVGLSADQIRTKLLATGNIKSVTVTLSPFWQTTTPDQASRITVKLNPAEAATGKS